MKCRFLIVLTLFGFAITSNAQEIAKNAIGLRLGGSNGFGAEISYQRALFEKKRLEIDFGFRYHEFSDGLLKLSSNFHWIWHLNGDFNWYAGPGIGYAVLKNTNHGGVSEFGNSFIYASGDIGIEYKFKIPLLLSLNIRPEFGFGNEDYETNDLDFDVGISARYTF